MATLCMMLYGQRDLWTVLLIYISLCSVRGTQALSYAEYSGASVPAPLASSL